MKLTNEEINTWCRKAIKIGYTQDRLEQALEGYPKKIRKRVTEHFNILKGGYLEMKEKKKIIEEDEEDFDEDDNEDEEEEEEEEEEVKPIKTTPKKVRMDKNWQIQRTPEVWRILDPLTQEVVAEALSAEELSLKLSVMSAQHSVESAKNTR